MVLEKCEVRGPESATVLPDATSRGGGAKKGQDEEKGAKHVRL